MRFVSSAAAFSAFRMMLLPASAVLGIVLILAFVLGRRLVRSRYFRRRDTLTIDIRRNWPKIVNGEVSPESWFCEHMAREIVQDIALDRVDVAEGEELLALQSFFRVSGLLDRQVREARQKRGWRRRKALLTLGRMCLPECIPALMEALDDARESVVLDAIRALGRVGDARAGAAILRARKGLHFPEQTLETALANCYRNEPASLLQLISGAQDDMRALMARALAAVATPDLSADVLVLTMDPLADVRASSARILSTVRPPGVSLALTGLACDPEWFVRLRAMVALGDLGDPSAIPVLISGLCDSNRLVRLRAATVLARMEGHHQRILHLVTLAGDRYALQALVSEMEYSGKIRQIAEDLAVEPRHATAELALRTALSGGAVRFLVNLMLQHPSPSVRENLMRILAESKEPALMSYLEQLRPAVTTKEGQALDRLATAIAGEAQPTPEPVPVA